MFTEDSGTLPIYTSICLSQEQKPIQNIPKPLIAQLKTTFDCGVQTCIDNPQANIQSTDDALMKKRQKRKSYKKRKKEKIQNTDKENKQQFRRIIDLFYQKDAKFIDYENRLEELVCSFNQKQFKNMFDTILKQRVLVIQNQIWEYTQTILFQNPLQMSHDNEFYLNMVDHIYKNYEKIQNSSQQAEQVIYIFLALINSNSQQPITPQDLGRRTFRYLIETDQTLRKLIHMCDKRISFIRYNTRIKLEVLISKLRNFRQRFDSNDEQEYQNESNSSNQEEGSNFNNYQDQKSTTISQQSDEFEEHSKNRRRKKKLKQAEIDDSIESIFTRMQRLTIHHNNRQQCCLEQNFVSRMVQRNEKLSTKSKKQQSPFDRLKRVVNELSPCKRIYKEYKSRVFD